MERYDPQAIEPKWQQVWEAEHAFEVAERAGGSGDVVRPRAAPVPVRARCTWATCSSTRSATSLTHFRRRNGMHVLHPMGWDSFGLPAENAAIKEGGHPREITERNIVNIRRFMQRVGWNYDWTRELSTHDPAYMRWQQWLFLRFFERGLAYRKAALVKWCPNDQTVLANEQVHDGRCERCGAEVETRQMEQWFFRITDYAQELVDDLENVDYPESLVGPAAQLDRPLRGRRDPLPDRGAGRRRAGVHDAAGHALRRDVLRPGARARARRADRGAVGAGRRAARLRAPRRS